MRGIIILFLIISFTIAGEGSEQQYSGRKVTGKRLLRTEKSIERTEQKGLKKIHKYHMKINERVEKTIHILNKLKRRVLSRSSKLEQKLIKYGSRKLKHMEELIEMADEDIKDRLKPIMQRVKIEMKKREVQIKEGTKKLVLAYGKVYERTYKQIQKAKLIGDRNDMAAKKALHIVGDNIISGLQKHGQDKGLNTGELRETKRITKETERNIYHKFHSSEMKEVEIIRKADKLLKKMKHKARKMFNKLRKGQVREYRKLFRK